MKKGTKNAAGTIDLARVEIKTLMSELQRREGLTKRLRSQRARLSEKLMKIDDRLAAMGVTPSGVIGGRVRRARNTITLTTALKTMLTGKEMRIPTIVDALPTVGYRSESPNLRTMVNVALLQKDHFRRISRGVYTAKAA